MPLHLAAQPVGVFIVVIADVRNTGNATLDLAAAAFTLEDRAGQVYLRAPGAELALTLLDTPPLATRPLPHAGEIAPDLLTSEDIIIQCEYIFILPTEDLTLWI